MRKNYLRGQLILIIPIILLTIMVRFLGEGIYVIFASESMLRNTGYTFPKAPDTYVSLKISNIEQTTYGKDDEHNFYIVETDAGHIMLSAKKDDKDVSKIVEEEGNLKENPKYLKVRRMPEKEKSRRSTKINIDENMKNKILETFRRSKSLKTFLKEKKGIYTNVYVEVGESFYYNDIKSIIGSLIIIGCWLFALGALVINIRTNVREYKEAEEMFPELRGDLRRLNDEAEFKDEKLKLLIYQGALVTYYRRFEIDSLTEIRSLHFKQVINKGKYGIKSYSYFLTVKYVDEMRIDKELPIRRCKDIKGRVEEIFFYLNTKYPGIKTSGRLKD